MEQNKCKTDFDDLTTLTVPSALVHIIVSALESYQEVLKDGLHDPETLGQQETEDAEADYYYISDLKTLIQEQSN